MLYFTEKDLTGLYEGDIQVIPGVTKSSHVPGGKKEMDAMFNEKRNAINSKEYLWPGKVVPYTIDTSLSKH